MICLSCREAGDRNQELCSSTSFPESMELSQQIILLHKKCTGCDCQHRIGRHTANESGEAASEESGEASSTDRVSEGAATGD